jgi:hypothetical protein
MYTLVVAEQQLTEKAPLVNSKPLTVRFFAPLKLMRPMSIVMSFGCATIVVIADCFALQVCDPAMLAVTQIVHHETALRRAAVSDRWSIQRLAGRPFGVRASRRGAR